MKARIMAMTLSGLLWAALPSAAGAQQQAGEVQDDFGSVVEAGGTRAPLDQTITGQLTVTGHIVGQDQSCIGVGCNLVTFPTGFSLVLRGLSPDLALQANGTGQSWSFVNDENNNFLRIRNNTGNTVPFSVTPSAGSTFMAVGGAGVGIGTTAPTAPLHLRLSNGTTKLLAQETSSTNVGRNMAQFINNGASTFRFDNSATGQVWAFGTRNAGDFFIAENPTNPALELLLSQSGDLTITGTLNSGSDRNAKDGIRPVDPQAVLEQVAALPISTWHFKSSPGATHMGPMAQDFAALFGLGSDDTHVAPLDVSAAALAAVQALHKRVQAKDAQLDELGQRVAALEAALAAAQSR